jgi:hypothetical protein
MVEFVFFFFTPRWQLLIFIFSRPVWIFSTIFPLFNSWYLSPFPACPIKNFLVAFSGLFLIPNGEICPFHSSNSFEVFLPLKAIFYCSCQHFKGRRSWATPNITTLYAQKNTDELKAGPDQEPLTETEYNAHKGLDRFSSTTRITGAWNCQIGPAVSLVPLELQSCKPPI